MKPNKNSLKLSITYFQNIKVCIHSLTLLLTITVLVHKMQRLAYTIGYHLIVLILYFLRNSLSIQVSYFTNSVPQFYYTKLIISIAN